MRTQALDLPNREQDSGLPSPVAGLDLLYACKIIGRQCDNGQNCTLETAEIAQAFMLACQLPPTSDKVVVSFDEQ